MTAPLPEFDDDDEAETCDECGAELDPIRDHDSKEGGVCIACARGEGREWARAQMDHPNVRG